MRADIVKPNDRLSKKDVERKSIIDTLRQITLADGCTQVYKDCDIDVLTLSPEQTTKLRAIALYALSSRSDELDIIDGNIKAKIGIGIGQIDDLYSVDGQPIAPPVIEVVDDQMIIVDGLHRILRSLEKNESITVVMVNGIAREHQLPFESIPLIEVAMVNSIPQTKRILKNSDMPIESIQKLYRDFGELGSNHRDQTYEFISTIPWRIHQIERNQAEMTLWDRLSKPLRDYAPPLPSMITKPPLRIVVSTQSGIEGKDHTVLGFEKPVDIGQPFARALFTTLWRHSYRPDDRYNGYVGEGLALLVNREHWQNHCTRLVALSTDIQYPTIDTPAPLRKKSAIKLPRVDDNRVSSVAVDNNTFAVFANTSATYNSCIDKNGNIVLGLVPNTLIGINLHQVLNNYERGWMSNPIEQSETHVGPLLLLSPDVYSVVQIDFTGTNAKLRDISKQIIERLDETQWFEHTKEVNPDDLVFDAIASKKYESMVNASVDWSGSIAPATFIDLLRDGQIVHLPTITTECINLLRLGVIKINNDVADSFVVLESRESPAGTIYVLPELSLESNLTANSMKVPSHKQRMDVSFTLFQTNLGMVDNRKSTGKLVQIQLSTIINQLLNSNNRLPFDMETIGHIFSSLATSGYIII